MVQPLLLEYYNALPQRRDNEEPAGWNHRFRRKLHRFKQSVLARYYESTLQRLLWATQSDIRQAAVLALGLTGTLQSNGILAQRLRDDDQVVCQLASDALWSVWFRADSEENNQELHRLMRLDIEEVGVETVLGGFDSLIQKSPTFAEVYNQRAIVNFRRGNLAKSITDCEKALRLNPYHFGAASGMAECFMKLRKFKAALRSYRRAHRIHPLLEGVPEAIASLEKIIGEDGKR